MKPLTARQQQILDYIAECVRQVGYPPTRADIATYCGFSSPNAAEDHLRALQAKGRIAIAAGVARGIRVLPEPIQGLPAWAPAGMTATTHGIPDHDTPANPVVGTGLDNPGRGVSFQEGL